MGIQKQQVSPSRNDLLWSFCRTLANETRLRLLFCIINSPPRSVFDLAEETGIKENYASMQLRELHTYGLIAPRRRKQCVYYSIQPSTSKTYAGMILPALIKCAKSRTSTDLIIHNVTAFTHQRRVEIVRSLSAKPQLFAELVKTTSIAPSALARHLAKLKARNFILKTGNAYCVAQPKTPLKKALINVVSLNS